MKRTLLIFLLVSIPVTLFAQESEVFRLGLKAGPNIFFGSGNSSDPNVVGTYTTAGFTGGGFAELVPIDNLSIELDVMFSWFNYGVQFTSPINEVTLQFAALELPLIVKGRLPLGPGTAFLGIGPDFIILLGEVNAKIGSSNIRLPVDQIFHTGLMFSGGYDWPLNGGSNLTLELRYLRVFSSPTSTYDIDANRFDFLIGWSVNL
jgi:hypothetical protein